MKISSKKSGGDSFDSMSKKVNGNMSGQELLKQQTALQDHARLMMRSSQTSASEKAPAAAQRLNT